MSKFSAADVLELPVQERLRLVEDIWNSIADSPETLGLSEEDKRIIDERLELRKQNPNVGSSWEDVYARITSRKSVRNLQNPSRRLNSGHERNAARTSPGLQRKS